MSAIKIFRKTAVAINFIAHTTLLHNWQWQGKLAAAASQRHFKTAIQQPPSLSPSAAFEHFRINRFANHIRPWTRSYQILDSKRSTAPGKSNMFIYKHRNWSLKIDKFLFPMDYRASVSARVAHTHQLHSFKSPTLRKSRTEEKNREKETHHEQLQHCTTKFLADTNTRKHTNTDTQKCFIPFIQHSYVCHCWCECAVRLSMAVPHHMHETLSLSVPLRRKSLENVFSNISFVAGCCWLLRSGHGSTAYYIPYFHSCFFYLS